MSNRHKANSQPSGASSVKSRSTAKSRRRSRRSVQVVAAVTAVAVLATGCSQSNSRQAGLFGGSGGNPLDVPALTSVSGQSGQLLPVFGDSTLYQSDQRLVATSTQPTIDAAKASVNGVVKSTKKGKKGKKTANGVWQIWIGDLLADPTTSTGWESLSGVSNVGKVRVTSKKLEDGHAYQWKATDPSGKSFGPFVFTVDTQRIQNQGGDQFAGMAVNLASGIGQLNVATHQVKSAAGDVGIGLEYQPGNDVWPGMPKNWRIVTPTSASWDQLVVPTDNADVVRLHSKLGSWLTYRHTGNGAFEPVWTKNQPAPTGQYPTLVRNTADEKQPWTLTDIDQTVITFSPPNAATKIAPVATISTAGVLGLSQEYDGDGRLSALVDPVSGRKVTMEYGGGDCPSPGDGFTDAPDGMLCNVKYWDGSQTWLGYTATDSQGPQVARVADYPDAGADGAQVTDIAYDNIGRVARLRSPLVTAAQAASVTNASSDDESMLTSISYDNAGRVVGIKSPAASKGATQLARNYSYVASDTDHSTVIKDQGGVIISKQSFDPNTFNTTKVVDADGKTGTYKWDPATGLLASETSQSGATTSYTYQPGTTLLAKQVGPSRNTDGSSLPTKTFEYDEDYKSTTAAGDAWTGLNFQVWPNATWAGAPGSATKGPTTASGATPDSLQVSWTSPPAGGGDGPWSARLSGNLNIAAGKDGKYALAAPGGDLWIDGIKCAENACANVQLGEGPHSVRIDFNQPKGGGAGIALMMDKSGTARTPVPMKMLSPAYGLQTRKSSNDQLAVNSNKVVNSIAKFAQPAQQRPSAVLDNAGLSTATNYEAMTSSDNQFGRANQVTLPKGSSAGFDYWAGDAKEAAPCSDQGKTNQGGMQSAINDPNQSSGKPDGTKTRFWYAESGLQSAIQYGDSTPTCLYYDDAGRVTSTTEGSGSSSRETKIDYEYDGNPLKTEISFSEPTEGGVKLSASVVETDLLGREIRSTDVYGTVTETTYDPATGNRVKVETTVNGGTSNAYRSTQTVTYGEIGKGKTGLPVAFTMTNSRDSQKVTANWNYTSLGLIDTIALSNGAKGTYSYDSNLNVTGISWKCADSAVCKSSAEWSTKQTYAPSGRIMTAQTQAGADTAKFKYTYDTSTRLQNVALDSTLKGLPKSWAYTYDANSNRTSAQIDATKITYEHDMADRLTKVTGDPVLSGSVDYDKDGSITKIGTLKFSYNDSGRVQTVRDDSKNTTVDYVYAGVEKLIGKNTTVGDKKTVIRYTDSGILLNGDNQPYAQQMQIASNVMVVLPIAPASATPARSAGAAEGADTEAAPGAEAKAASPSTPATEAPASQAASPTAPTPSTTSEPSAAAPRSPTEAPPAAPADPSAPPAAPAQPTAAEPTGVVWSYQSLKGDTFWSTDAQANPIRGLDVYSAFGELLTAPTAPGSTRPDMRWASANQIETESLSTGVNLLGSRLYLPALGRFTSVDPVLGGSANAYDYGNQDPVNNSDPTGESAKQWWHALKIVIIGVLVFNTAGAFGAAAGIAESTTSVAAASGIGSLVGAATGMVVGVAAYGLSHISSPSSMSWQGWVSAAIGGAALGAIAGGQRSASLVRGGIGDGVTATEATANKALNNPLVEGSGKKSAGRALKSGPSNSESMALSNSNPAAANPGSAGSSSNVRKGPRRKNQLTGVISGGSGN